MLTAFDLRWRTFGVATFVAAIAFFMMPSGVALSGQIEPILQPPIPERTVRPGDAARHDKTKAVAARPATSAAVYAFGPGDRLKVTFYERSDLSGEFRVRSDGRISLPVIGTVRVEGKDAAELETDIADAFFKATKRSAYVNVEVVERRPFYVVGFVNKPGAYPFVPGMTVVHALAIAGGVFRSPATVSTTIDLSRESWRRKQALESLKRALARHARLESERDGLDAVKTPDRLVHLAGQEHAEALMASEQRIHSHNRKALKQRMEALLRVEKLAEEEIKAQRSRLESMRAQEKLRRSELKDTEQLANRGLARRDLLYSRKYGISALKSEASEVVAEIARAERTLAQARRDRTMLGVETRTNAQSEITAVKKEIESFEHEVRASEDAMRLIGGASMGAATQQASFSTVTYEVMRRDSGSLRTALAEPASRLHPGDVLRVTQGSPASAGRAPLQAKAIAPAGQVERQTAKSSTDPRPTPTKTAAFDDAETGEIIAKLRETLSALETLRQRLGRAEKERRQIIELMTVWRARAIEMNRKLTSLDAAWRETGQLLKTRNKTPERSAAPRKTGPEKSSALPVERSLSLQALGLDAPRTRQERILIARVLQTELKRVGCYAGRIDGIWGQLSVSALSRFSSRADLAISADEPSGTALRAVLDTDSRVCAERGRP